MTGILKKGLRGLSAAGAEMSMENHRANIQVKRDAVLQKYQTSERQAGEKHDIEMANLNHKLGGGGTQGDIQLMNYFIEHGIAASADDAYNKVREMNTDPSKVILDVAKSMQAADNEYDRKPFEDYVKVAETQLNALRERQSPKKEPPKEQPQGGPRKGILNQGMGKSDHPIDQMLANNGFMPGSEGPAAQPAAPAGETVRIQSEDDYNKLASGTRYVAPDGKTRVKK